MNAWLPVLAGRTPTSTPALSYTDTGADGTDSSTYTFSSRALGTAASDRKVIIGVWSRIGTILDLAATSVTVQGISATAVAGTENTGVNSGADGSGYVGIWIADVPTGTTGDVVVTMNNTAVRCCIAVWSATGITGSPYAANTYFQSTTGTTLSLNANVTSTAVAVAIAGWPAAGTATWTGLTENVDAAIEIARYTAASFTSASTETPRTISITLSLTAVNRSGTVAVFT